MSLALLFPYLLLNMWYGWGGVVSVHRLKH